VVPTDDQGRGPLANRGDNPAWSKFCGMNVALVFDQSGSIDSDEWAEMRVAAQGFVTALRGTPSQISMFSFASEAPALFTYPLTSVKDPAEADALIALIGNLPFNTRGGATNWDEGLWQVAESKQSLDAVLMLTDGDPTVNRHNGGSGGTVNVDDVTEAVFSANAVKAMGTGAGEHPRLVGIGIGMTDLIGNPAAPDPDDKSYLNLAAITGPNIEGQDPNYYETSFAGLDDLLTRIVREQCNGTITVDKYVTTTDKGPGTLATDRWPFTATVVEGGGTPTSTPADGMTGESGDSQGRIQFTITGGDWAKAVRVQETPLKGSELLSATCTITRTDNDEATDDTTTFGLAVDPQTQKTLNYVEITGMIESDNVSCEFLNKVPTSTPTPTPTPTPTTEGCTSNCGGSTPTPTPTPTVEAAVAAEPLAATVAEPATAVEPATVTVPEAATVPESVPAGGGSEGSGSGSSPWGLALIFAGLIGLTAVFIRRSDARQE
jgi:hypothetical protein